METESGTFRPPYMSFQTFWSFIEELAAKPLPPRVDRSLMTTKSGTDQNNLTMALTSFGLTDETGRVQPALTDLVAADSEARPGLFRALVERYYAAPLTVSKQNGTTADLNTSFTETWPSIAAADTRRKSITFFLHAARSAGIELSPHFPQGRAGSGGPGTGKPKRSGSAKRRTPTPTNDGKSAEPDAEHSGGGTGYSKTVNLRSGGVVTLVWDVNLAESSDDDEDFVLALVRQLRRYQAGSANGDQGGES